MNDHSELKRLAEAFPDYEWDSNQSPFFNGPSGESLGGDPTGFYCVYGQPFEIEDETYDGVTLIESCPADQAKFICEAKRAVLALIAEVEALRKDRTDWQAECLKLGFEYVRAPDDHYVLADVPEMARLLGQLLGVEVRDKENDSYGETISELHEQVEAGNNAFHRAYAAETECDRLKEEVEALKEMALDNQRIVPVKRDCIQGYGHGGQWCGPDFNCWLDPRSKSEKNGHGKGCVCSVCTQ